MLFRSSPHLANLGDLSVFECGLDAEAMRRLAAGRMPRLDSLTLTRNLLGPQGAMALADGGVIGGLSYLCLEYCEVGDEGAMAVASAEGLRGKQAWLSLDGNGITDAGARALARSPYLGKVRMLSLKANDLSDAAKQELRERFGEGSCGF